MKIGSIIHPKSGKPRHVEVHGTMYAFAPVKDKHDATHFVAEVTNEAHVDVLIGSGDFYAYGNDLVKQPALSRTTKETAPAANANDAEQKPDTSHPSIVAHAPDDVAAATDLLKGSIPEVGQAVANQTLAVIRAALAIEEAAEQPRKGMVSLLVATLEGAQQAGVKG